MAGLQVQGEDAFRWTKTLSGALRSGSRAFRNHPVGSNMVCEQLRTAKLKCSICVASQRCHPSPFHVFLALFGQKTPKRTGMTSLGTFTRFLQVFLCLWLIHDVHFHDLSSHFLVTHDESIDFIHLLTAFLSHGTSGKSVFCRLFHFLS